MGKPRWHHRPVFVSGLCWCLDRNEHVVEEGVAEDLVGAEEGEIEERDLPEAAVVVDEPRLVTHAPAW
jgi:hypothetical protein